MSKIVVTDLGKAYKQYPTRWSRLVEWLDPRGKAYHRLQWVLQDVNFSVNKGEAVGIIGINGAGKSTLLKMITGTTQPTTGSVHITGRVAAMLELGMGFHPDFTGRENVYMAGQLLGYTAEEIFGFMPAIEEFAEIGDYIDQPVRVYSSGMQVRLAFSLATCTPPDVLIVDEALSVGDTYFQHKSFDRIRKFREQGTTLLIVSHDKAAIQSVCDRAILLKDGQIALEDKPEVVMDYYNALLADSANARIAQEKMADGKIRTISGTGEAQVQEVGIYNDCGERIEVLRVGERVELRIKVVVHKAIDRLVLGYGIKDHLGQIMYGTNTWHSDDVIERPDVAGSYLFSFKFHANLGVGSYSVDTALTDRENHLSKNYEWRDLAAIFNVVNVDHFEFSGCAWTEPTIEVKRL